MRIRDELSKSWGQIVGVEKRGYVIQRFCILLDGGFLVKRTREELFVKPDRKTDVPVAGMGSGFRETRSSVISRSPRSLA